MTKNSSSRQVQKNHVHFEIPSHKEPIKYVRELEQYVYQHVLPSLPDYKSFSYLEKKIISCIIFKQVHSQLKKTLANQQSLDTLFNLEVQFSFDYPFDPNDYRQEIREFIDDHKEQIEKTTVTKTDAKNVSKTNVSSSTQSSTPKIISSNQKCTITDSSTNTVIDLSDVLLPSSKPTTPKLTVNTKKAKKQYVAKSQSPTIQSPTKEQTTHKAVASTSTKQPTEQHPVIPTTEEQTILQPITTGNYQGQIVDIDQSNFQLTICYQSHSFVYTCFNPKQFSLHQSVMFHLTSNQQIFSVYHIE